MRTAILFLVFNRPQVTARVFEAIRAAKPSRLFVAADGPRAGKNGEVGQCNEVRKICTDLDWECNLNTLFREENLGCRDAVSEAIDWFFEHEERGIILEDDCLPDPSFFDYCEDLLEFYQDDPRVLLISGDYFHGEANRPAESYYFSRYNHCWGWASWRSAWRLYDRDMAQWPALRDTDWLFELGGRHADFSRYWKYVFDKCYAGEVHSWAYRWMFSCWVNQGLTALPSVNLIKNIGFDDTATHTTGDKRWVDIPLERIDFPLARPDRVIHDFDRDRLTDLNVVGTNPSLATRLKSRARRTLSKIHANLLPGAS